MSCQSAPAFEFLSALSLGVNMHKLEGPGSVGGPMRCPWFLFHRLFLVWARTQGPHDPLLPGGP
ncbi:unnamed protein product, partial [Staurois parvus]